MPLRNMVPSGEPLDNLSFGIAQHRILNTGIRAWGVLSTLPVLDCIGCGPTSGLLLVSFIVQSRTITTKVVAIVCWCLGKSEKANPPQPLQTTSKTPKPTR